MKIFNFKKGSLLVTTLVFASIATIIISGVVTYLAVLIKTSSYISAREQAFHAAESGIDYYRWHLAHAPSDFQDGTGRAGPYTHILNDKDGNPKGIFELTITPPSVGSTLVTIKSVGRIYASSSPSRSITTKLAVPSFAKYAVVANDDMRFGEGTEVFGPIHSNGGIRFDGLAHNIISSSLSNYNDPDHTGSNEFSVHTHVNTPPSSGVNSSFRSAEAPPSALATRADVFIAGRLFPVATVDFNGITADLSKMKADASTTTGAGKYFSPSGAQGYYIVLKTNDTFDVYKVTALTAPASSCTNVLSQTGWGTWSIKTKVHPVTGAVNSPQNFPLPANGIIFVEDHLWVDGQINTARVTLAAGSFPDSPTQRKSITVNNDLLYTNYDGTDVLALIAQHNINIGMVSDTDLRIDGALIAQNGRVGRFYYDPNDNWPSGGGTARCSPYHTRTLVTLYGMIGTNIRYGFAYTDNTGYSTRTLIYDPNLLYGPPPSFPLTSDQYQTIFWEENK